MLLFHRQFILVTKYRVLPSQQRRFLSDEKEYQKKRSGGWTNYLRMLWHDKEINTIPNLLTMSRIIASPGLSLAIAYDMKLMAFGGCVIFGFTDWLDGYIAKNYNQQSRFGAFLDPLADKILIGALSIGLTIKGLLPLPLLGVWIGRDVLLIAASFVKRAIDRPSGAHFFDTTSSATFVIKPSELSKINTGLQFTLLSGTFSLYACGIPSIFYLEPLWWITTVTTVTSGLMYLDGSGIEMIKRINNKTK